jgi:hypothetical protein
VLTILVGCPDETTKDRIWPTLQRYSDRQRHMVRIQDSEFNIFYLKRI